MNTDEINVKRHKKHKEHIDRPLTTQYLRRWYVLILTVLTCFPGYAAEVLMYNFFAMKNIPHFAAAVIAIFLGGMISTLPFFILSMVLAFKKKKYYALAIGVIVLELVGMAFFLYNQIILTGM